LQLVKPCKHDYNRNRFSGSAISPIKQEGITVVSKKKKSDIRKRSLGNVLGEWILVLLILVISGITGFFYTRSHLSKTEGSDAMEITGQESENETQPESI